VSGQLAIYSPALGLSLPREPFGKDVANQSMYRAFAEHGSFDRLNWLTAESPSKEQLQRVFLPRGGSTALQATDLLDLYAPCLSGTLLRGQPYLAELAWMRGAFRQPAAYSLVGLIHTLAPPAVRELIGGCIEAPVQPWDALVCTSPCVQQALQSLFDQWEHYLRQRLGARQCPRPQLPLIPLGVDLARIQAAAADGEARKRLRQQLGLGPEDLLVLWVGRLSYFEKAFPQPMFEALQRAQQRLSPRLHCVMAGWFPGGDADRQMYREAAERLCSSVPVHVLDGRDPSQVAHCWAAADLFLSLVDNIQETFGLSPVEAMAAGLPVVASDWDGYRSTVRHGEDGFLIPTLGGPGGGIGDELAARHWLGLMSYQDYVGSVAQHTAVDVEAAAEALVRLGADPMLRSRMGASGQQNVRDRFDWPVVVGLYRQLFAQLAELRRLAAPAGPIPWHPLRGNPFTDFAGFASTQLGLETPLRLSMPLEMVQERLGQLIALDRCYEGCHAQPGELESLLMSLARQGQANPRQLLQDHAPARHQPLLLGLAWLAKMGLLRWS
jgi:glycosyltransferase involved in cell wall biosynthesis